MCCLTLFFFILPLRTYLYLDTTSLSTSFHTEAQNLSCHCFMSLVQAASSSEAATAIGSAASTLIDVAASI